MITWAFSHVLREYVIKVCVLQDGKIVEVDASTGRETFAVRQARQGRGRSSARSRPACRASSSRGRSSGSSPRRRCGGRATGTACRRSRSAACSTSTRSRSAACKVVPRDVLLARIEPRLRAQPGETDVCVMYNTVDGVKDGKRTRISYHLWDEADTVHGVSAMGRVTGYSAAIGAVMVGKGMITEKGIVAAGRLHLRLELRRTSSPSSRSGTSGFWRRWRRSIGAGTGAGAGQATAATDFFPTTSTACRSRSPRGRCRDRPGPA